MWKVIAIAALIGWFIAIVNGVVANRTNKKLLKDVEKMDKNKSQELDKIQELKVEAKFFREQYYILTERIRNENIKHKEELKKYKEELTKMEMKYIASVKEQVKMAEKMEEMVKKCEEQK